MPGWNETKEFSCCVRVCCLAGWLQVACPARGVSLPPEEVCSQLLRHLLDMAHAHVSGEPRCTNILIAPISSITCCFDHIFILILFMKLPSSLHCRPYNEQQHLHRTALVLWVWQRVHVHHGHGSCVCAGGTSSPGSGDGARIIREAVITVPSKFTDAQAAATKRAGRMAGLERVTLLQVRTRSTLCKQCTSLLPTFMLKPPSPCQAMFINTLLIFLVLLNCTTF